MSEDVKDRKYKLGIWVYKVYFVINMNDNGKKKKDNDIFGIFKI